MDHEPRHLSSFQVEEMGRLVDDYFSGIGRYVRVSGFDVTFPDGSHGGLANLARTLVVTDRAEWPRAIEEHFTGLGDTPDRPASWDEASSMIRLLVFPADHEHLREAVVWPINDELVVALVLHTDHGPMAVTETELTDWHVKTELSFDRGLHNALQSETFTDEILHTGDAEIHVMTGALYTSARLLVFERFVGHVPGGAVVALPDRTTLLYHLLADYTAVGAINALAEEAALRHKGAGAPISPHLFWWREGALTPLPTSVEGGRVSFDPPEDFVAVLNEVVESTKRKRRFFGRD